MFTLFSPSRFVFFVRCETQQKSINCWENCLPAGEPKARLAIKTNSAFHGRFISLPGFGRYAAATRTLIIATRLQEPCFK